MFATKISALISVGKPAAALILTMVILLNPMRSGGAQSLDEAVNNQLAVQVRKVGNVNSFVVCGVLLNDDPVGNLSGKLRDICDPNRPDGGGGPSSTASGGGAATANMLPGVLQKRLRGASQKKTNKSTGSSEVTMTSKEDVAGVTLFYDASEAESTQRGLASFDNASHPKNWIFKRDIAGISVFIAPEFESLNRGVTKFGDGYDSDIWRLTAGADYQISEDVLAGIAVDYQRQGSDFEGGGSFDTNTYGALVYGAFSPIQRFNFQAAAGYSWSDSSRERQALFVFGSGPSDFFGGAVKGHYGSDQYWASVLADYDVVLDQLTLSPRVGLDWRRTEFDAYREKGNTGLELRFDSEDDMLLQTRVGIHASVLMDTDFGTLVPQVSFDWLHDFANNSTVRAASFVGDSRFRSFTYQVDGHDEDYFELNAGLGIALSNGIQGSANYRLLTNNSFFDSHAVTAGIRVSF